MMFRDMRTITKTIYFGFKNFKGQRNPQFKNIDLRKDYYKILGVGQDSSLLNIRKAYMKLVKQLHPDVNSGGHDQFTQVQEAYKVLGNGENKNYYDNNNIFFDPPEPEHNSSHTRKEDLNERDRDFYDYMKYKTNKNFDEAQYQREKHEDQERIKKYKKEEMSEEQKQKRRLDDQIELTRIMMFSRNPLWQQANNHINCKMREQNERKKQKELEDLFSSGTKIFKNAFKWFSKS